MLLFLTSICCHFFLLSLFLLATCHYTVDECVICGGRHFGSRLYGAGKTFIRRRIQRHTGKIFLWIVLTFVQSLLLALLPVMSSHPFYLISAPNDLNVESLSSRFWKLCPSNRESLAVFYISISTMRQANETKA